MTFEVSDDLKVARVLLLPNDDGRVEAGRSELASTRRPADPAYGARVSVVERGNTRPLSLFGYQLARLGVRRLLLLRPDTDRLVAAA